MRKHERNAVVFILYYERGCLRGRGTGTSTTLFRRERKVFRGKNRNRVVATKLIVSRDRFFFESYNKLIFSLLLLIQKRE